MNEELKPCEHKWEFLEHCLTENMAYRWDKCRKCSLEREIRTGWNLNGPSSEKKIIYHDNGTEHE